MLLASEGFQTSLLTQKQPKKTFGSRPVSSHENTRFQGPRKTRRGRAQERDREGERAHTHTSVGEWRVWCTVAESNAQRRVLNTSLSTVAHESIVDTSSFGRAEGGLGSGLLLFESKDKLPLCLADTLHAQA